ncbi:MAG: L-histidine N(alpha)-methyltransferase [Thiobacillus sp.]|nr:L-histidine N(alpha)-methyltransferase [Thiobacillus sp.]
MSNSYKFRRDESSALANSAGWQLAGEWEHDGFAVQLHRYRWKRPLPLPSHGSRKACAALQSAHVQP